MAVLRVTKARRSGWTYAPGAQYGTSRRAAIAAAKEQARRDSYTEPTTLIIENKRGEASLIAHYRDGKFQQRAAA